MSKRKIILPILLVVVALFAFVSIGVLGALTRKVEICHVDESGEITKVLAIHQISEHVSHTKDRPEACVVVKKVKKPKPQHDPDEVPGPDLIDLMGEPDTQEGEGEETESEPILAGPEKHTKPIDHDDMMGD